MKEGDVQPEHVDGRRNLSVVARGRVVGRHPSTNPVADSVAALDEAPRSFLRERALASVAASLAPAPFLLLPFVLLVGSILGRDISSVNIGWWLLEAVGATGLTLLALYRYYLYSEVDTTTRATQVLFGLAFAAIGAMFGMSTWVANDSDSTVLLMFTLFPATSVAVGAIVTAGRRDLFLCMLVPATSWSAWTLLHVEEERLRVLASLITVYGIALVALHHIVSRNSLDGFRLQWRTDQLVRELEKERAELTVVNDQLASINVRLAHQATHDPLTALYNRRGTLDQLENHMVNCSDERPVSLLFCDLDHFKAVNDALGHRGGDKFITEIARRLAANCGPDCIAGRMGGDEFVLVMPGLQIDRAAEIAQRLVAELARPIIAEGREVPSSVSVGLATAPTHGRTSSELLRHANAALYKAKQGGRNRVVVFDAEMQRELAAHLADEQALRDAIDGGAIRAFFQPEFDATTGHLVGAELLARWVRPDGDVVPAQQFLAIARTAKLLERVTETVIVDALPHLHRLVDIGLPGGFRFRINVAPEATERNWRTEPIDAALSSLDPQLLTIDVHERYVDDDLTASAANLAAFRARGGRVCLDDFARGMSTLDLLRRLPIDEVRIDHRTLEAVDAHPHDRSIMRSVIGLVRDLGLSITAEGVETAAQADALVALGCVRHQGHLYAPAMRPEEFEDLLVRQLAERVAERMSPEPNWDTGELA